MGNLCRSKLTRNLPVSEMTIHQLNHNQNPAIKKDNQDPHESKIHFSSLQLKAEGSKYLLLHTVQCLPKYYDS